MVVPLTNANDTATLPKFKVGKFPILIAKLPREGHTQFYERAEKAGVGRLCHVCEGKRRFSMCKCPYCHGYMYHQVEWRPPADPVEGEPKVTQSTADRIRSQASGDGNFTFAGNSDFDPNVGDTAAPVATGSEVPLPHRSIKMLRLFAAQQEIPLGKLKKHADVLGRIEEHMGGLVAAQTTEQNPPEPEGTFVLDTEGAEAAKSAAMPSSSDEAKAGMEDATHELEE